MSPIHFSASVSYISPNPSITSPANISNAQTILTVLLGNDLFIGDIPLNIVFLWIIVSHRGHKMYTAALYMPNTDMAKKCTKTQLYFCLSATANYHFYILYDLTVFDTICIDNSHINNCENKTRR